jgi:ADP-ribosylglycohydrolase
MARQVVTAADRARGGLLGLAAGQAAAGGVGPGGELALACCMAEELLETAPDFHRLAGRWIAWWRQDGTGISARTAEALDHLARFDAPAPPGPGTGEGAPLIRALPMALAMPTQPRNLVSGTYHAVMLTHPDPHTAWSAVAVNVAAARLFQGKRDFIPDVIEALVANDAPTELLAVIRRLPFAGRDDVRPDRPVEGAAVATATAVLWVAHQEPVLERGVRWLGEASGEAAVNAALGCALLGLREGEVAIPEAWVAGLAQADRLRELAKRLSRALPVPA